MSASRRASLAASMTPAKSFTGAVSSGGSGWAEASDARRAAAPRASGHGPSVDHVEERSRRCRGTRGRAGPRRPRARARWQRRGRRSPPARRGRRAAAAHCARAVGVSTGCAVEARHPAEERPGTPAPTRGPAPPPSSGRPPTSMKSSRRCSRWLAVRDFERAPQIAAAAISTPANGSVSGEHGVRVDDLAVLDRERVERLRRTRRAGRTSGVAMPRRRARPARRRPARAGRPSSASRPARGCATSRAACRRRRRPPRADRRRCAGDRRRARGGSVRDAVSIPLV